VPVLASTWIDAALTRPLTRDRALLGVCLDELAVCPLGAGALGGTTLPIDPRIAAAQLEVPRPVENPVDAVGQRDVALTLLFCCARISLHLARFCADVVELSSDGLCDLSGAIACGSSMMPHKKNPDLFELVRGHAALRHGELTALLAAFHGLGSGYHRDLQHDKALLFSSVDGTLSCLRMITLALPHLHLRPDACLRALRDGDAIATDLCEHLVTLGVPFRDAYRRIGALVAHQRARGLRLADLGPGDLATAALAPLALPTSLLDHLDPTASAHARTRRPA
jgi:argininosuccinate lyase